MSESIQKNKSKDDKGQLVANTKCKDLIHKYCNYGNHSGNGNCRDYLEMTSSSVIYLLKHLKDKYKLEYDKLAEYAILWLSYKLNKSKKNTFKNLNEFYTKYIEKNKCYNKKITDNDSMTYKEIIDTKKDLMDMNINEISKFNPLFHILFYLYYAIHDEYWDYTEYPKYAINFANKFEELSKNSNNIENSSYNKLLSTLSNDYDNLKNKCNYNKCTNFPSLPKIEPKKSLAQTLEQASEATSSSYSILDTEIPGLSTFSVIPVFLVVAYKCKLLLEADRYFKGKDVNTNEINKHPTIKGYCYNGGCKTNEDVINALAAYIIMSFKRSIKKDEYNNYDEYLLMWLSDKLFEIHNKSEDKDNEITLNQAYEKYLEEHKRIFNYWSHFDIIKDLKEANLKYMSEFYKLLNKICKTITDYEKNPEEITNHISNSTECSNQYISIYNDIPKCQSYLDLLNKLKGAYDDFRSSAIYKNSSNSNLATELKKLTKPDGKEMDGKKGFISYKFSDSKCKLQYDETKEDNITQTSQTKSSNDKIGNTESSGSKEKNLNSVSEGSNGGSGDSGNGKGDTNKEPENSKSQHSDNSIMQGNSLEQHEDLSTPDDSVDVVDNLTKDKESTDNTMEQVQRNDAPESNLKEIPQEPQLEIEESLSTTPSEEPSGNQDSDQNDKGSEKTGEDPGNKVKGNGITKIDDIFIFKGFKKIGIPIIVIIISITLAIMYKVNKRKL
ncbi:hypothetical protein YYE_04905 [Plasmodium vinckei vinckei]|uniref:PIR protein CIR protein n=1 Tax=Plasmodium vinckei vinckei TaxID=54757 RepID=A0A081I979_PLAVN|nr:hypothetical protein YYE_04905 [Plasmodium vinckei vinckei]